MVANRYIVEGTSRNYQQLVLVDFWLAGAGPSLRQKSVLGAHLDLILCSQNTPLLQAEVRACRSELFRLLH